MRQRQGLDFNGGVLSDAERAAVTDPGGAQPAAAHPDRERDGLTRRGALHRHRHRPREHRPVDGRPLAPVRLQRSTPRLLRVPEATSAASRTCRATRSPASATRAPRTGRSARFNYTHIFGSNVVNEARFGFNRSTSPSPPTCSRTRPTTASTTASRSRSLLPQITVNGVGLNFGGPNGFPQGRTDTTFVLSDTVTWARGRHALKFGGEYRRFHNVNFQNNVGTFTYPSLADFQAGRGNGFTATLGEIDSDITQQAFGLFVQDNVRLSSRTEPGAGPALRPERGARPRPRTVSSTSIRPPSRWSRSARGDATRSTGTRTTSSRASA